MQINIDELMKRASERYDAMLPSEQDAMWKAQRDSFVRSMTTPCEHGELDWETCPRCLEKFHA